MKFIDIILILLVSVAWGANVPISAIAVSHVPPIFFLLLRFIALTLLLVTKLPPIPRHLFLLFMASMCMGWLSFIMQYVALLTTTASNLAIISQLSLPFATIFSIIFLNEKVAWKRGLGMALAFIGVIVVVYKPLGFEFKVGDILGLIGAILTAIGTILMKKMDPIEPMKFQAWNSLFSILPLLVISMLFEHNQITDFKQHYKIILLILAFTVLFVSLYGHTMYFYLIKKYEVTQVMPYTLLTPIWAVLLASVILKEQITLQIIIGGLISIVGVALISVRSNKSLGEQAANIATKN